MFVQFLILTGARAAPSPSVNYMVQSRQSLFHSGGHRPMAQLYFYYSAMNAGREVGYCCNLHTIIRDAGCVPSYTAEIDDRFGAGKVSSRIGLSSPAKLFNKYIAFEEIRAEARGGAIHCVLVDESQFWLANPGLSIIRGCRQIRYSDFNAGTRTDFRGESLSANQYLLTWSEDKLVELKTICFCGRKASMVLRLDQDGRPYNEGEQIVGCA
ncbi:thymidine kinase [Salmonella enterica subsp. enterica]|nr:thymidine kinase [Salmonella enterica subsp. enterica]